MSGLRDHKTQFDDAGAQVLGVSLDSLETQTRFAARLNLPFPLLSDKGGTAAKAYGVKGLLWAYRTTFVIDEAGKIISIISGRDAVDPGRTVAACLQKSP